MTRGMTTGQAAEYFERLPAQIEAEFSRAFVDTLADGLAAAQSLSSGPYTLAALRLLYNPRGPYSAASPHPPADPGIINEQSGRFKRAWRTEGPAVSGTGMVGVILNDAPEVRFLKGTRKMMARPVLRRLEELMKPIILKHFQGAVERATR